jgi:ABC-type Fe3+/spermidine/putrescine transport system ATPase subunit
MQVRLAFSIAIKAKNDILIFDEVLAVGDVNFQRKCFRHFTELKRNHQTVVFVSHSMEQVKDYCTRVIVIDGGTIIFDGDPEKAVAVYDELNEEKTPVVEEEFSYISGNGSARVQDVAFSTHQLSTNDDLTVKVHYKASPELEDLYYGISIYRGDRNQSVFALADKLDPKKELLIFKMKKIPLTPGKYYFTVGLTHEPENWKTHYDLREKQYTFTVKNTPTSDFYALAPAYIETEVKNEA